MKVGLIFGKFAPLTAGHVSFIREAVDSGIDRLYLFLSYDQKFNDTIKDPWMRSKLGLTDRLRDLKLLIRDSNLEHRVFVNYVDESNIPDYPEGGKAYAELIREKIPADVVLTHAFSSEPEYTEYFSEFFPEVKHVVIDAERNEVDISATRIRNNLFDNFWLLSEQAKPRFVRKVAIIGVESTGKSTMAARLARLYHTTFTPEIGRTICEDKFCGEEALMLREDYLDITRIHRILEGDQVDGAYKVTFSDTNHLITHFSALCAGKVKYDDDMFTSLNVEEGCVFYDLVLYLSPEVEWVADPLRLQDNAQKRQSTNELLLQMVDDFYWGIPVVHITGVDYEDRIQQAMKAVNNLLEK